MLEEIYLFANRHEAGVKLAARLSRESFIRETDPSKLLLLSIPSGGVVVGATAARALGCPHDVIAVKKISCPWHREVTIGAVAEYEMVTLNPEMIPECRHRGQRTGEAIETTKAIVKTFIHNFRANRRLDVGGKVIILVDDGISTGETMSAALKWLLAKGRTERPQEIVVAVPICSPHIVDSIAKLADRLIYLSMPTEFWTVGQYYWDYAPVTDKEIHHQLESEPVQVLSQKHQDLPVAA